MAIPINDGFQTNAPRYVDMRAGKLSGGKNVPFDSFEQAFVAIPVEYRCSGLMFMVKVYGITKTFQFTDQYATDGYELVNNNRWKITIPGPSGYRIFPPETFLIAVVCKSPEPQLLRVGISEGGSDIFFDWDTAADKTLVISRYYLTTVAIHVSEIAGASVDLEFITA